MKLVAHMAEVSYKNIIENNLLPHKLKQYTNNMYPKIDNIRILSSHEYEEDTVLGEEKTDGWITKSHYSGKLSNGKYQIVFEPILENDESIKDYYLSIKAINREQKSEILRYCPENNLFFSSAFYQGYEINNRRGSFYSVAGKFSIEINNIKTSAVDRIIPVFVLPSSLTLDDYMQMINELREIREDLVIDNSNNVGIGTRFIMKRDYIEDKIKKLESVINQINKRPRTKLKPNYVKKSYNSINKITYKTMIEKHIYPHKNTFSAIDYEEVNDIYENRILKGVLADIKEKLYDYERFFNDYVKNENFIISDARKVISDNNGKGLEDFRKEIVEKRDKLKSNIDIAKRYIENFELYKLDRNRSCEFTIYKNSQVHDNSIKITYDDSKRKFVLEIRTFRNNIKGNKFNSIDNIYNKDLNIILCTNDIDQIKFLVDNIQQIISKADSLYNRPVLISINAKVESAYLNNTGETAIINCTSIEKIGGIPVRAYSEEEKEELIKKYTNYEIFEESLGFMDSILNKESSIYKIKKEINNSWDILRSSIDKLTKLSMFEGISLKKREVLKPTQIFINDPLYRKVYKIIRELNETILISDIKSEKMILMKSTCDIYEIWCLFKIVHILVVNQGWKLINSDEVAKGIERFMELKEAFSDKQLSFEFIKELRNNKQINLILTYEGRVYYDENKYKKPDYQFTYIIKNMYGTERIIKSYLDAKYRNYSKQGEQQKIKDLKDVAIGKYIKPYINTQNKAECSMIVHSDSNYRHVNWGGDNIERETFEREAQFDLHPHGYGIFYAVPSDIRHLMKFLRLLSEYHNNIYDVCWVCGETENIDIQKKVTRGNNTKYHYKCNKCDEFWVKNHCFEDRNHHLIKHIDNYHLLNNKKKNPWHLICPICGNGN